MIDDSNHDDLENRVIEERYRILKRIGPGAFAQVYLAEHIKLKTQVAMKILREECKTAPYIEQFKRESRFPAQVGTGVVKCLDYVTVEGRPTLVMEYIKGQSLKQLLAQRAVGLKPILALRIACQIADTLVAAQERGVVHRDLTPSNLLITDYDPIRETARVKVIDWGLATEAGPMSGQRPLGLAATQYCPPERPNDAQPSYDLFSFGTILYQMLTGELPSPGVFDPQRQNEFPPLDHPAFTETPPRLRGLLKRWLTLDPSARGTAESAQHELLQALQEEEKRPLVHAQQQLAGMQAQHQLTSDQLEVLRERSQEQGKDLDRCEEQVRVLLKQAGELTTQLHQIPILQTKIEEKRKQVKTLQQQHELASQALNTTSAELERSRSRLSKVESDLRHTESMLSRAQHELQELEQLRMAQAQEIRAKDAQIQELESKLAHFKMEHKRLMATVDELMKSKESRSLPDPGLSPDLGFHSELVTRAISDVRAREHRWRGAALGVTGLAASLLLLLVFVLFQDKSAARPTDNPPIAIDAIASPDASLAQAVPVSAPAPDQALASAAPVTAPPAEPAGWHVLSPGFNDPQNARWLDVWRDGAGTIYIVGDYCKECPAGIREKDRQEQARAVLLISTDGGSTFRTAQIKQTESALVHSLYGLWGALDGTVFAVGEGVILKLSERGNKILQVPFVSESTGERWPLRAAWGRSASEVYITSADPLGHIVRYEEAQPGQVKLTEIKVPTSNSLRRLRGIGADMWAVGDDGAIVQYSATEKQWISKAFRPQGAAAVLGEVLYDLGGDSDEILFCGAVKGGSGVLYRFRPKSGKSGTWDRQKLMAPSYSLLQLSPQEFMTAGAAGATRALRSISNSFPTIETPIPLPRTGYCNMKSLWGTGRNDFLAVGEGVLLQMR